MFTSQRACIDNPDPKVHPTTSIYSTFAPPVPKKTPLHIFSCFARKTNLISGPGKARGSSRRARFRAAGSACAPTLHPAMANASNGPEGAADGKGGSQLRPTGSTYLKFVERFASFCQRSDAISSSDDSDSPLGRGLGRTSGRSWMSGRLGRSKKSPDQVRGQLLQHIWRVVLSMCVLIQICGMIHSLV